MASPLPFASESAAIAAAATAATVSSSITPTKRKRARTATAAVPRDEVVVDSSRVSVPPEATVAIIVEDDSRPGSETDAFSKAGEASCRRQRQTTLTNDALDTPEEVTRDARVKSRREDAAAPPSDAMAGGELRPSSSSVQAGRAKKAGVASPATPALDGPRATPLLEEALLAHIRNALVLYAVRRSQRTIGLTATPSAAQWTDMTDAFAASVVAEADATKDEALPTDTDDEDDDIHVKAEEEETAAEANVESAKGGTVTGETQGLLALPCVQHFILHECARVARVVREEGGKGLGDDPSKRAFEMLGLLLSMLDSPSSFSALLALACPSCRSVELFAEPEVGEFLVLSQRAAYAALPSLSQTQLNDALGLLDGCRDSAGAPIESFHCCPYGEAHVDLQLLLVSQAGTYGKLRNCSLRCDLVPYQTNGYSSIAVAAKDYYRAFRKYLYEFEKCTRAFASKRSTGHSAEEALKSARRRLEKGPEVPKAVLALLRDRANGVTWAEDVFHRVLPDAPVLDIRQRFCHESLQARIRAVYAYTQTDVLGRGGYFNVTLSTPTSFYQYQSLLGNCFQAENVLLSYLFTLMKVCQHIAEGLLHCMGRGDDAQRCLCHTGITTTATAPSLTPRHTSFLLMEEHVLYLATQRRCREEQYLLVDETEEKAETAFCSSQAVGDADAGAKEKAERSKNVNTDESATALVSGSGVSYYAAGSAARFRATLDLTRQMNARQVVDFVARVTAEASPEALSASDVPAAYIHAELKRHQLEDVQWMWGKETEGYREHAQVPLYCITLSAAARLPFQVRRFGTMLYCATTGEAIIERGAAAAQTQKWTATDNMIYGGLLCDDVGLGKTLSVLTLCAYDRAMRESGAVADDATREAALSSLNRFWQVAARHRVARSPSLAFNTDVLRWGFGAGIFHAGTAPHTVQPTRLPRTTLVVVPLSIATQWIDELRKFYPSASYVLFYGAKRTDYTVHDLQRADFVFTTYETLSTHLRQETDGVRYWLSRSADAADDKACADAIARGWPTCWPSQVNAALQAFAASTVWSQLSDEADLHFRDFSRSRGYVLHVHGVADAETSAQNQWGQTPGGHGARSGGGGRGRGWGAAASVSLSSNDDAPPLPPQPNDWELRYMGPHGFPGFHCPAFTIFVHAFGDPAPSDNADSSARQDAYRRLFANTRSPVSDVFLDGLWELLKGYSASTYATQVTASYSLPAGLFNDTPEDHNTESFLALLFKSEARYPMSDHIRRLFVRHVLLPSLWQPLKQYWTEIQPHYAAVSAAENTGRMPLRILDLLFRRVVLDESQKCGAKSLFHLLLGERRWVVTGTPLNNNKTQTLSAALSFLGMNSAAQLLSNRPLPNLCRHGWLLRHDGNNGNGGVPHANTRYSRMLCVVKARFEVRMKLPFRMEPEYCDAECCFCASCMQNIAYGVVERSEAGIPLECRRCGNIRFPDDLPCLANALMEILALAMVRHSRTQQVSRELHLSPVRYNTHRVDLTADEMQLYDRVARMVMRVAARLHRQGVLSSRMGLAMQWVQQLCRLCLHPSRVGDTELLRSDIEARIVRGAHIIGDDNSLDLAQFSATFVTVTAEEALKWAQSLASSTRERANAPFKQPNTTTTTGSSVRAVPEETVAALSDLKADPPLLPLCGVCMDNMVAPTLLNCLHMFCKECVIGVIDASRSYAGNVNPKCPYCRDRKSMLAEKRVITAGHSQKVNGEPAPPTAVEASVTPPGAASAPDFDVDGALARVGDGSRVRAFVNLVQQIWESEPSDGVLVFSKYPAFLQLTHDAVQAAGYAPHMVCGASTLAQRQRVMRALQQPGGAVPPVPHRILFVTSRSANAGLNLTFANHVIFLEPNLNPAMEQQAVGRVHRFGQLKQVTVHHLYAPRTIEDIIYHRSVRLRVQAAQQVAAGDAATEQPYLANASELQRYTQFGRIAPTEMFLLLEYPVPAQHA